ncbi:MAG TPA: hypothetical protein PKA33_01780 [Amaricoccus sp.]|uniref:hypothetical protein n=1 Tax=Amaricoccus sp. TaxID=1872485 RepID=UPI002BD23025|nr:hypothetical protein [Amaricoccus sp.]HMR51175.1 hypothetical protein [Amaricoccus sp.]HMT98077.1 hypothetical protein [Amaricoccus sp.]
MPYLVSIAPADDGGSPPAAWLHASGIQKSARRHPDFAHAGPGVLFQGGAGWVVDRDTMTEVWVPATKWAGLQPEQHARYGICEVGDPTAGHRVTGWTIDRAAPSVTLVEVLIDPTDALPLVTEAQIDAGLPPLVAEFVLREQWREYDEALAARNEVLDRFRPIMKARLAESGRRLNAARRAYLLAAFEAQMAAAGRPVPPMPVPPSSPRPGVT